MGRKVKYCEYCRNHPEQLKGVVFRGYSFWHENDCYICSDCCHKIIDTDLSEEEWKICARASHEPEFLESMIELKKTDEDKYYDKLAEIVEQYGRPQPIAPLPPLPKCPHCRSTRIKTISGFERGVSVLTLGLFSKKINKSFKCNNCGYTW